jgi:hypothetical protein
MDKWTNGQMDKWTTAKRIQSVLLLKEKKNFLIDNLVKLFEKISAKTQK